MPRNFINSASFYPKNPLIPSCGDHNFCSRHIFCNCCLPLRYRLCVAEAVANYGTALHTWQRHLSQATPPRVEAVACEGVRVAWLPCAAWLARRLPTVGNRVDRLPAQAAWPRLLLRVPATGAAGQPCTLRCLIGCPAALARP
ncbi:hypothetical protein BHE74_00034078 [Ensete ventricosum]|nr:hypothetical protein BHE74_00034078 [Ensete ventricosum]